MPAGTSEVRHFHAKARQFFFVLSGKVTLEIGGSRDDLGQYEGAEVPPGVPHQIFNNSEAEVEFLVISQPSTHGRPVSSRAIDLTSLNPTRPNSSPS
jgi:mannose-6-phosphate isomerase-like protein (cupin superfamily)